MSITPEQFFGQFTKEIVAVHREETKPTMFGSSFFKPKVSTSRDLSIEVERNNEKVAVDVVRTSSGNYNKATKSSEKIFTPPFFKEFFLTNELDLYERALTSHDSRVIRDAVEEGAKMLMKTRHKIERAIELMAWQVYDTGVVALNSATNIDFGRVAGSKVDASANTWATGTNNPITDIENGCNFLRQTGKATGNVFNCILSGEVLNALLNNATFQARGDVRAYNLDAINKPQKNALGGVLHGAITAGSYTVLLWTYPEYYDLSGVSTAYVPAKKFILLPENPNFTLGFGQVPLLSRDRSMAGQPFVVKSVIDEENDNEKVIIKSAPLTIPSAIDQIYTGQVLV